MHINGLIGATVILRNTAIYYISHTNKTKYYRRPNSPARRLPKQQIRAPTCKENQPPQRELQPNSPGASIPLSGGSQPPPPRWSSWRIMARYRHYYASITSRSVGAQRNYQSPNNYWGCKAHRNWRRQGRWKSWTIWNISLQSCSTNHAVVEVVHQYRRGLA